MVEAWYDEGMEEEKGRENVVGVAEKGDGK